MSTAPKLVDWRSDQAAQLDAAAARMRGCGRPEDRGAGLPAGKLHVRIVRSVDDIGAIAGRWRALQLRAADPMTWFQSLDWCRTWCRFHAADIRIATVWSGDSLVLVWPLMVTGSSRIVRRIAPLTMPHAQYGNMIVDPLLHADGRLAEAVADCLERIVDRENPDLVVHADVPVAQEDLQAAFGDSGTVEPAGASSWMDLTGFKDWDAFRSALGRSVRKGRNRRRNALERLGKLDYVVRHAGEPGYAELVRAGVGMKRVWLRETGRATMVVHSPDFPDFLSALSYDPETRTGAVTAALLLDGRPVAIEIGFEWFGRFYSYLGAFDWSMRSYSPGKLQLEEAMRWCIERGIHAYDLLGEAATYKSDWSNMSTPMNSWGMQPTLRGKAYSAIWSRSLRPAAKSLMQSAPLGLRTRLAPIVERVAGGGA